MPKLALSTLLTLLGAFALGTNVHAQNVQDDVPSAPAPPPSQGLRVQQSQLPARQYTPGVRYTTGSVTVSGWEKGLTDGDPNLRHWNWSAVTSYTQTVYGKVPAGAYLDKNKQKPPGSIYVKPIHVSPDAYVKKTTPYIAAPNNGPQYTSNSSSRTGTGAIPIAPHYPRVEAPAQSNTNVSAKIRVPKASSSPLPIAGVPPAEPMVKTYGGDYTNSNVSGQVSVPRSNSSVYGKLMRKP